MFKKYINKKPRYNGILLSKEGNITFTRQSRELLNHCKVDIEYDEKNKTIALTPIPKSCYASHSISCKGLLDVLPAGRYYFAKQSGEKYLFVYKKNPNA